MTRMLFRASGRVIVITGVLCGAAALAADPGRPKIVNNSLYAADGQKMRGDTLFLTNTTRNNRGDEFTLKPKAWSENAHIGFNIRRLWASGGTEANHAMALAKIDQCVDLAARAGQYVIIVYGPPDKGPIGSNHHKEFWSIVAPRYKDRTHVIYELANEPPDAWPTEAQETATSTGEIPMAKTVRDSAPHTPIILFSNDQNPRAPSYYQQFQDGYQAKYGVAWSWANALVGFHGYYNATTAKMQAVKAKWPCINTEVPTYYRGDGEKTAYGQLVCSIEDDWDEIIRMEQLGIAWIEFSHCTRTPYGEPAPSPWYRWIFRDFDTGPLADYLVKKNVAWWVKGPAVAVTSPEHCTTSAAPASVSLTASAADGNGTIAKVEFYSGATRVGETTAAPYSFTWNNVAAGSYSITARAANHAGASYTSYPVKLTVLAGGLAKATIADSTAGAQQKGNAKERAYDGNLNTRWANDGTLATAWIQYDLGSAQRVAAVKIRPYNGRTMTYPIKIEVGDGSTMTTVWSGNTEWWEKTLQTFDVNDISGRYVKITMTGNNSHDDAWLGIYETEIYVTGTPPGPPIPAPAPGTRLLSPPTSESRTTTQPTSSAPLMPRIAGDWWTVAGSPDLGDLTDPKQQPVDFSIWEAADGTWQLWSCIRNTKVGGRTRLFYRWEGKQLTDTDWKPMGVTLRADPNCGEESVQSPHVIKDDGVYHMFYGDWNHICQATSQDGKTFTRVVGSDGKTGMFGEGAGEFTRDPMVLRIGDTYHCYYCANPEGGKGAGKGVVFCRTSPDLKTWSESKRVAYGGSAGTGWTSAECPFVIVHDGLYYLFRTQSYGQGAQTRVYRSKAPLNFGINDDRFLVGTLPVAAPEIVEHDGQTYIASLLPSLKGIRIAKLGWETTTKEVR